MRIGLVIRGGVDRSGRERVVPALLWLIERLARRHAVHVFVLDYYNEPCSYPLLGATVHDVGRVLGPPGLRLWRLERRLAAAVREHGPFDLLHAYMGMPAGVVGTRVGRRLRIPVVLTLSSGELVRFDDLEYGLQRQWVDRRAVRAAMQAAAALTVPTAFMANLCAPHGMRPDVVADGVDVQAFPHSERADGPPWRIIRVGSINRVKDHTTLLHAVAALPASVSLDIVGEDLMGGAMQTLAHTLGLDDRVQFHGWQPTDALARFYARAHLHVVSSAHEASSVAMLEAASTGLTTVGTAVGYVADWQPDRAVAVPVRDARALADAVLSLLQDPERRRRIATAAREWTLAHDADWSAAAFERLYASVMQR